MSTKTNERKVTVINYAAADQTVHFNSLIITTAGDLVFKDLAGTTVTVPGTVPVGKFECQGSAIVKTGTTITGLALDII